MPPTRRCTGTTKAGKSCKANPLKGQETCRRHGDASDAKRAHTEDWKREEWLGAFEYAGTVTEACKITGISRQTAYMERQRNEDFALAWADIEERVVESMEREAYRRAVEGVEEPLVSAGQHVTNVRKYSDGLLQFLLKARKPETYRERLDMRHSGTVEKHVRVDLGKLDDSELEQLERLTGKLSEA